MVNQYDILEKLKLFKTKIISEAGLLKFFDLYTKNISSSKYYKSLESNAIGAEQNITNLIEKKLIHSIATIGFLEDIYAGMGKEISDDTILAITLFELTQVDFADTIAEVEIFRNYESQIYFFESLKNIAIDGDKVKTVFKLPPERLLSDDQLELINNWDKFLIELCSKFYELMKKYPKWNNVKKLVVRRLEEYYWGIARDHVRKESELMRLNELILSNTYNKKLGASWKSVPSWVSKDIWLNFFLGDSISFLIPIELVIDFEDFITKDSLVYYFISFRGVAALNVLLDDIIDKAEDQERFDKDISQRKVNVEIFLKNIINLIYVDFEKYKNKFSSERSSELFMLHSKIVKRMIILYYTIGELVKIEDSNLKIIKNALGNLS